MGFATRVALGIALLVSASAQAAPSFTKIADQSTPVPGWTPGVEFGAPSVDAGAVAFHAVDQDDDLWGIYTGSGGAVTTVADRTTLIPGSSETFFSFFEPAISQGTVAFNGSPQLGNPSVYTAVGGALTLLADDTTPHPGGSGTLLPDFAWPAIDGANVAFRAYNENGFAGFYTLSAGVLETSVDETTSVPGGSGNLIVDSMSPGLDGTQVAFKAHAGTVEGVYVADGGLAEVVADTSTAVPGGSGNFTGFREFVSIDDGNVVFVGEGAGGDEIYGEIAGVLMQVSAGETFLYMASIDGDTVAYHANDAGEDAIYVVRNGVRERIVGTGDLLDGKVVNGFVFGSSALSGDQLAFTTYFADDSFAVYVATIPEPGTAGLLAAGVAALGARRRRLRAAR